MSLPSLDPCPYCGAPSTFDTPRTSGHDLRAVCTSRVSCGAAGPRVPLWDVDLPDDASDAVTERLHHEAVARGYNRAARGATLADLLGGCAAEANANGGERAYNIPRDERFQSLRGRKA